FGYRRAYGVIRSFFLFCLSSILDFLSFPNLFLILGSYFSSLMDFTGLKTFFAFFRWILLIIHSLMSACLLCHYIVYRQGEIYNRGGSQFLCLASSNGKAFIFENQLCQ